MGASAPMNFNERKTETVSVRRFVKKKRRAITRLADEKNAEETFGAAQAALKSLSGAFKLPADENGTPLVYIFAENYISLCGGNISEESLSVALSSEKRGFSCSETESLPDMLRIAAAERLCDIINLPEAEGETSSLIFCDEKISQIDFSRILFGFCPVALILSEDETFSHCSDESKREYIRRVKEKAIEWNIDEAEAAQRCLSKARANECDLGKMLCSGAKKSAVGYFVSVCALTLSILGIYIYLCSGTPAAWFSVFAIAPVYELSKRFVSAVYLRRCPPSRLLSLSSGKELDDARCLVTIATVLYGEKRDCEVFDRLEDFYLRNRDGKYIFSVLGDLGEAEAPTVSADDEKISYAKARISALNEKYGGGFALFIRKRTYVGCQKKYMAWERKRGGILNLCRFAAGGEGDWICSAGNVGEVRKCTYLLTLDRDTELFYGSVRKLTGIMLHPANRAVFDEEKGRIVSGYGVIQPAVIPSLFSANATLFASLTGGDGGLDVYTGSGTDFYQNVMGIGCFCGKGMIDISAFLKTCDASVAGEKILSHDIIEGSLLRCGAASGVVLTDGTPSNALSYYTRLHRWIRGDLQSLPYLCGSAENSAGERIKNPVGAAGKYRIADNAIRHFAPLSAIIALFLSLFSGNGAAYITALFAFAYIAYPLAESIVLPILSGGVFRAGALFGYARGILYAAERFVFSFMSTAHEAYVFADAAVRTAYRFSVSGEHFLDWKTAADGEAENTDILSHYGKMLASTAIGLLAICVFPDFIKLFGALWALFPAASYFCSSGNGGKKHISKNIRSKLKTLCAKEWRFFADNVGEKTNWLPPDNYQFSPVERVAMRTSPTNIGMFLISALAARDFGYIDSEMLAMYIENAAVSVEKLLKWRGNLYNWYDLKTLEVIGEPFVSSVDSGNFAVCLVAVCEGLKEYAFEMPSLLDTVRRLENILLSIDLSALYDRNRKLFYIGYNVASGRYSDSRYDIFMSESRLTGYYAVATGQVPSEHYFSPARRVGAKGGRRGLLSWSGTAFEYFMPSLFLPAEKGSAARFGLDFAYAMQRKCAGKRFLRGRYFSLWGMSESQYFGFDSRMNYQYKAFGAEALSLDPEFEKNEVISPYSVFLMMRENPVAAMGQLAELRALGASGKYGFCESVDFSSGRVGDGYAVMKSYMSHHKGMSLAAAANICFDDVFVRRFMRSPTMRAGKILLCERVPDKVPVSKPRRTEKAPSKPLPPDVDATEKRKPGYNVIYPEVCAVSNGKTRITASSSGHILLSDGDDCIAYSDFDRFSLSGGLCLVAEVDGKIISAVPLGYTDESLDSEFSFSGRADAITYSSVHRGEKFSCDFSVSLTVSPEHSEFILSARLNSGNPNSRIMLFFEPIMCGEKAYKTHKCFSGLFLECDFNPEENAVVFRRRPRGNGEAVYLGITAKSKNGFEFDTGADDLSSGYGEKEIAELIRIPCGERTGAPTVPLFRAVCKNSRSAIFSIGYSKNKDDLLYFLGKKREKTSLESICAMMKSAAGIGVYADAMERYLLRAVYFPQAEGAGMGEMLSRQIKTSDFYRFSLSGELPMLVVRFFRFGGKRSENLKAIIGMFRYACIRGLRFDLLIFYREIDEYRQSALSHIKKLVKDMGCESFISVDGGIFPINADKLTGSEKFALERMCGAVCDSSQPLSATLFSNKYFTPISDETKKMLCRPPFRDITDCNAPIADGAVKKVIGGVFHRNGFFCNKKEIKRPWAQIVSTGTAGFVATQNSLGFTFGANSSLQKLTPHDGRAMTEDGGELLIMRITNDAGRISDFDMCACAAYADYFFGGVKYVGRACGISYTVEVTLDEKLAMKYISVKLSADTEQSVEIIYSVTACLGASAAKARQYLFSANAERGTVSVKRVCGEKIAPKICIMTDADKSRVYTDTAALKSAGAVFGGVADCAAVGAELTVGKRTASCGFALFAYRTDSDGKYCREAFLSGEKSRACTDIKPDVTIKTSDPVFDMTVNRWFNYQCVVSRITARTGFYQNGGAYGFRDQLQDCLSVGGDMLKKQIIFCACHQYEEGDVMHWWHNLYEGGGGHYGIRTRCSDDCAWLLYGAEEYIRRSGDMSLLDIRLPFVSSPPLDSREIERYEFGRFTEEKYPLFFHLLRAAERLCRLGDKGLSLFGTCDWNDGMNEVGKGGKGESVWLSQFAAARLSAFAVICAERGDGENAERFEKTSAILKEAVEMYCFEGDRYLRGFFDDGSPLGSKTCDECRTDILPQAFSVLGADGNPSERAKIAITTAINELYDRDLGIIKLLSPPFDKTLRSPGYIKGYPPGIRENGGQYTHAAIWGAMATAGIGEGGVAYEMLRAINPAIKSEKRLIRYGAEPYVLCGDVGSYRRNAGRGGWSWYTGAAGWYRTAVISSLCGYKEVDGGFYISPVLSESFDGFSLEITKGKSVYRVCVSIGEENAVRLDGETISKGKPVSETVFYPDGKNHSVRITVKK
ncbi:MAG: hypothetical protein MR916_02965 [Eubacterium sp.]|nr:hypothetical protein [Eubacterium sp.]